MASKEIKDLYYLTKKTEVNKLVEEILSNKKKKIVKYINGLLDNANDKELIIIEDITQVKEKDLENSMRFYRGAVLQYYYRQSREYWDEKISNKELMIVNDEIKAMVGFKKYDKKGKPTKEVGSMADFKEIKMLNTFLNDVENVCFNDQGYIFPNSKHFNEIIAEKGLKVAKIQALYELKEQYKNKHYKREI